MHGPKSTKLRFDKCDGIEEELSGEARTTQRLRHTKRRGKQVRLFPFQGLTENDANRTDLGICASVQVQDLHEHRFFSMAEESGRFFTKIRVRELVRQRASGRQRDGNRFTFLAAAIDEGAGARDGL